MNVLLVTDYRIRKNAGGPQVILMIKAYLEKAGHDVDVYSYDDAFPQSNKFLAYFGNALFPFKAARAIRGSEKSYDLIQADQGTLPAGKRYLKTEARIVYHSHGLWHFQREYGNEAPSREHAPDGSMLGRVAGTLSRAVTAPRYLIERCIRHADIISVLNRDEYEFARSNFPDKEIVLKHNGLSEERLDQLAAARVPAEQTLDHPVVGFIGLWNPRKGALDLAEVFREVKARHPDAKLRLMGTGWSEEKVYGDFPPFLHDSIEVVLSYDYDELPTLLSDVAVGVLPSYIEGFGLAVLEMLAAGIPTVAYDVPGPRDMLHRLTEPIMVPPGDKQAMANRLSSLIDRSSSEYASLSDNCFDVARQFQWNEIIDQYLSDLGKLGPNAS